MSRRTKDARGFDVVPDVKNAAVEALTQDDLFKSIAESAVKQSVMINEGDVYGFNASNVHHNDTSSVYHFDRWANAKPMLTIWLAVTDAPYPVEFLRGSNVLRADVANVSAETLKCQKVYDLPKIFAGVEVKGKQTAVVYDRKCAIDKMGGPMHRDKTFTADLKAGDVFVFTGDVLHTTTRQPETRLALSIRYIL